MWLFVYGTLMSPFAAHSTFMKDSVFLGYSETLEQVFTMYSWKDSRYPMIIQSGNYSIKGELYDVPTDRIAELDQYEDVPTEYTRQTAYIKGYGLAHLYILNDLDMLNTAIEQDLIQKVDTGDWKEYLASKQIQII